MRSFLATLPRTLLLILGLGFLLRAVFLLVGAPIFYHSAGQFHVNGDSYSYMASFENWWQLGRYSSDFNPPDAAVGRLPGYPIFYGVLRLLVGPEHAPDAVAWTQVLLDSATILLVYGCVRRLAPARPGAARLGALLYATYPFIILWTPIVGTESLSSNLAILWLYGLLGWRPTFRYALLLGLLLAVHLYVREYMAVLLPVTLVFVAGREYRRGWQPALRLLVGVGLGFGLLYVAWPIRNYVSLNRIILLKPRTAGYVNFTPEVEEFNAWVHCWSNSETPWRDSILQGSPRIHFPADVFPTPADAERVHQLVAQARTCGTGYYIQRKIYLATPNYVYANDSAYWQLQRRNCNAATGAGFAGLHARFRQAFPARYWLAVPLQNVQKAFFKSVSAQQRGAGAWAQRLLLAYRSLLLLLGWAGLLVYARRQPALLAVGLFAGIIYGYMWFIIRGVEMRYLLQVDILLLLPATLLLHSLFRYAW